MSKIGLIKRILIPDWVRVMHEKHLANKEYHKAMNLPKCEYEDYLVHRYAEMMDKFEYTRGMRLDFNNPLKFTEKIQWLKLYDQSATKSLYADKYAVREHIKETIGEEYLIPLITINGKDHFYSADEIDYDLLPNSFVLKCNHGSHYNIIVPDKRVLSRSDIKNQKKQLNKWLKERYAFKVGLELVYEPIAPCIIIEKYISIEGDLPDYKFMCFSGEVKYVWVDTGRFENHCRTLFDLDYNKMPFKSSTYPDIKDLARPTHYEEMVNIAKTLCQNFIFVRVDLYNVNGKVYFGELTFSSGSGYVAINPTEYEITVGDNIIIDQTIRDNDRRYRK